MTVMSWLLCLTMTLSSTVVVVVSYNELSSTVMSWWLCLTLSYLPLSCRGGCVLQ